MIQKKNSYSTALRRTELARLQLRDLNRDRRTLFVHKGKGGKDRVVPVGERALRWIERYLEETRPLLQIDMGEQGLFLTGYGREFRRLLKNYGLKNCEPFSRLTRRIEEVELPPRPRWNEVRREKGRSLKGRSKLHPATAADFKLKKTPIFRFRIFQQSHSPNSLGNLIRKMVRKALGNRGSCHLLRHACATHMLDHGADSRVIQQLMGHAKLETTQIYTEVSIRLLQEVHAKTHPAEAKQKP